MRVYIDSDHRGFELRQRLVQYLTHGGHEVHDLGTVVRDPDDDYTDVAERLSRALVADGDKSARGILLCGSGQGVCMAANRFAGVRAALALSNRMVHSARNDDDANVLCIPAEYLSYEEARAQVHTFLTTEFAAAKRYIRRARRLDELGG